MDNLFSLVGYTVLWAGCSTFLISIPGIPLAYLLARYRFPGKNILSGLVSLPLVLPPTAVGYLLLQSLADSGPFGVDRLGFDLNILFTWKAILLASSVMSFPLFVRTARVSFEAVNPRLEGMARTLGYGPVSCFFRITFPMAFRGLGAAAILGFSRAMGEFGASILVAGNIPGHTQTLATAIYSAQQSGQNAEANFLLWVALVVGFSAVFVAEKLTLPHLRKGDSK